MSEKRSSVSHNIPIEFSGSDEETGPGDPGTTDKGAAEYGKDKAAGAVAGSVDQSENMIDDAMVVDLSGDLEPSNEAKTALAEAEQQIATLRSEKQALYEQVLRRQAEFDNFRKRLERERIESFDRMRAETLKQFLPIVDNFERALKHGAAASDEVNDGGLRVGVELIYKQLTDLLTRGGIEPIEAVGKPFDPHLHEAVTTTSTDEYPESTVLEELQRGYLLNGKMIRPAVVRVSVKKG